MRWTAALVVSTLLLWGGLATAQQQYGTLTGTVTDEQGGVLPGATVTLSSPALIGGEQTAVTGAAGTYTFRNLPPGAYMVKFAMSGFSTLTREGIVISVATTTKVDVELKVGSIEETVTVTGESPVVDVKSTITQTNIEKEIFEAVPTGRNPWVMANLVPGMVAGRLDVGGNAGMQQYTLEISGSANSQKSFSIDGLKTNWPGGSGGWTMQYYDFGMYEEYNFQTSAGTAESDVAGVYMNMVTKSGGNELSGTQSAYYMNENLQSDNVDDTLRSRLGLGPNDPTGIGGNPIDKSYDLQGTLGGPIVRDKLWFFGSGRWWRLDQFLAGSFNPDGTPVIDDNRITNLMGKVTWQVDPSSRFFLMLNKNWKYRWHRNLTGMSWAEEKATNFQKQPAQNYVFSFNRVLGTAGVLDLRFGRMWGVTPYLYQDEITPDDIMFTDTGTGQALRAGPYQYRNPNHRYQFNANISYYVDDMAGTHDFKFGFQVGREKMVEHEIINNDLHLVAIDGVADEAFLFNTPFDSDARLNTYGIFAQDTWTIGGRATLNVGVRFDGIQGRIPAQHSDAGTWVGPRDFSEINNVPDWGPDIAPRIGLSWDLFGDGKTALKAYYGRFYIQTGSTLPNSVNPVFESTVNVPWNDLNGDLFLDPGPSGGFIDSPELDLTRLFNEGFIGGTQSTMDPNLKRPYSDNFDVGIQHEIMPDFSIGFTYHRRQHRRGIGRPDRSRPSSAYSPVTVTYDDPVAGSNQTVTAYSIDPAFLGKRDLFITNVDQVQSNYNGIEIVAKKRMSKNWQLLGGFTWSDHKGFDYSDSYIQFSDFNNPNFLLNRDNGSVWIDLPWTFKLSGSYTFPHGVILAGKYEGRAGDPLTRTLSVRGFPQGTEVVYAAQRGEDRTEAVTQFVDVSLSKSLRVGNARIEPVLQVFNLLNANHVRGQRTRIGSSWGKPSRILSPRIVRFGLKWIF